MVKPGPARRPALTVVREGNPGHHPRERLEGGIRVQVALPAEPDWAQWWPPVRAPTRKQLEARHTLEAIEGGLVHIEDDAKRARLAQLRREHLIARDIDTARRAQAVARRARVVARAEWRRVVPILHQQRLLTLLDETALVDWCRVVARIDQCERDLSEHGMWVPGERGAVKNPSTTAVNQLRSMLKFYAGQFGLTPPARDAMPMRDGTDGDEDDEFD